VDWIEENIAIGNFQEAKDAEILQGIRIASALSLDGTLSGLKPQALGLKRIEVVRLEDGPGNDLRLFNLAVAALGELVRVAPPVLVQCHAGRSRSVVIVAAYLMKAFGLHAEAAVARVASKREISVTPGLERLLEKLSRE
jgi:protein-tyrosine phosphatase